MNINKLSENTELYDDVAKYDLIEKILPLLKGGFRFDKDTGKLKSAVSGFVWETPWITVKHADDRQCFLWHQVLFKYMDVIPSGCLKCWKVVARPNTLEQMLQLHDMMRTWDRPSKIGIELRAYVRSLYGAYWYNNSQEQGKECLDFVKEQIHTKIDPDIDVHLKRYCTEFELKHGPSDRFEQRPEDKIWEKIVMDTFDVPTFPTDVKQPEAIVRRTLKNILEYADKMKDPTVWKYNGGEPLMKSMVKYGEEEE